MVHVAPKPVIVLNCPSLISNIKCAMEMTSETHGLLISEKLVLLLVVFFK